MVETIMENCRCICEGVVTPEVVAEASGWLKTFEVGLIILVVVLVIIALIIGFSKMKGKESDFDDDDESDTYY